MYDVFIYTGDSPINTPGLGIGLLISWIFRIPDQPPAGDEEQGQPAVQGGHSQQSSGGTRYGEERAERERSSTEVEEVQDKNTPWDHTVKDRSEDTGKDTQETEEPRRQSGEVEEKGSLEDSLRRDDDDGTESDGEPQSKVSSRDEKYEKLQEEKTSKNIEYDRPRNDDSQHKSRQDEPRRQTRHE